MLIRAVSLALVIAAASTSTRGQVQTTPPDDFRLKLTGSGCNRIVFTVDTFAGRYTRFVDDRRTSTALFKLTDVQQTQLFQLVASIPFFDLPEHLPPSYYMEPSIDYTLTIQQSGRLHTVSWENESALPGAERLHITARQISDFFDALPEVKRLPRPAILCL